MLPLVQVPGLAVVLVGSRKDSETYVRNKKKACEEAGIQSFGVDLPEDVKEEELLKVVRLSYHGRAVLNSGDRDAADSDSGDCGCDDSSADEGADDDDGDDEGDNDDEDDGGHHNDGHDDEGKR